MSNDIISRALREESRQRLMSLGDAEFTPNGVAEAWVIADMSPNQPHFLAALAGRARDIRAVVRTEREGGTKRWWWTGSGSTYQRWSALSAGKLEGLAHRNLSTIEGFINRQRELHAAMLISQGISPQEANTTAEALADDVKRVLAEAF